MKAKVGLKGKGKSAENEAKKVTKLQISHLTSWFPKLGLNQDQSYA
jgi:hypothetical protein